MLRNVILAYPCVSNISGKHPIVNKSLSLVSTFSYSLMDVRLSSQTSWNYNQWCYFFPDGMCRQDYQGKYYGKQYHTDGLGRGTKDWIACFCTMVLHRQPSVPTKCITKTNCNRMTTTQAHPRSVLWWYRSSALNSCSCALCNILQGTVVPLMGKGQTRLWKSLFTASCLAVWSRSQQLLKWNESRSHRLILFFWMLAALQWHRGERHKHTVSPPP